MLSLIKSIIWIAGLITVTYFVLNYFGYEINRAYFSESKEDCQEKLKECSGNVFREGVNNAECDFNCVDPKILIKKK
jgi:hypothetical protein